MPISRRTFLKDTAMAIGVLSESKQLVAEPLNMPADAWNKAKDEDSGNSVQHPATIAVDCSKIKHTMAGGAGASWHAIGPTGFWYKNLQGRANRNARGSGWGGYPPLERTQAWDDIRRHARWLALNFIRVEIDQRMYEPGRGRFDWDNDEMGALLAILDWCEENKADVFFTQMWPDVEWNAYKEVGRLQSAPKSVQDFVHGVAVLMQHLVQKRGYSCIRWLAIVNEPGLDMTWWLGPDGKPASLMPALRALRAELDQQRIDVHLSGPDYGIDWKTPDIFDFDDPVMGAHDGHNYSAGLSTNNNLQELWAKRAHSRRIPFFQSEFGSWAGDNPFKHPETVAPRSYLNQLINAENLLRGMNVGVDGFNRWSFLNRGDLDGQWQLVRTWNPRTWDYDKEVLPEPVPYYSYGILTRFMAKYSRVLEVNVKDSDLIVSAILSPKGNFTIYILNKSGSQQVNLAVENLERINMLYKYQVTEGSVERPEYQMNPLSSYEVGTEKPEITDELPSNSITVYSSYKLEHAQPGIMID